MEQMIFKCKQREHGNVNKGVKRDDDCLYTTMRHDF